MSNKHLNILGCSEDNLEILMDIAEGGLNYDAYNIILNQAHDLELADYYANNRVVSLVQEYSGVDCKDILLECPSALGVVGIDSKPLVYSYFNQKYNIGKHNFPNLFHPTSYISETSYSDGGIMVDALSVISAFASIGFGVTVKRSCSIGHHSKIGDYVTLNPGVVLSGRVIIGRSTMLGTGCIVKDHVEIGANSIIGVGSVVIKDIPSNVIAYGNPCQVVKERI